MPDKTKFLKGLKNRGWTEQQIGARFGKNKTWARLLIWLLQLPEEWQIQVASGELSNRKARALCPYVKRPEVLAAVAEDMKQNPAEYTTGESMKARVDFVAKTLKSYQSDNQAPSVAADPVPAGEQAETVTTACSEVKPPSEEAEAEHTAAAGGNSLTRRQVHGLPRIIHGNGRQDGDGRSYWVDIRGRRIGLLTQLHRDLSRSAKSWDGEESILGQKHLQPLETEPERLRQWLAVDYEQEVQQLENRIERLKTAQGKRSRERAAAAAHLGKTRQLADTVKRQLRDQTTIIPTAPTAVVRSVINRTLITYTPLLVGDSRLPKTWFTCARNATRKSMTRRCDSSS